MIFKKFFKISFKINKKMPIKIKFNKMNLSQIRLKLHKIDSLN
jgi:hypothetical protein